MPLPRPLLPLVLRAPRSTGAEGAEGAEGEGAEGERKAWVRRTGKEKGGYSRKGLGFCGSKKLEVPNQEQVAPKLIQSFSEVKTTPSALHKREGQLPCLRNCQETS